MNAAAKAMDPAAQNLGQQKWKDAIPEEQNALQYLLRAEATFRQIEVAFGSRMGGSGGGGGSGRDLQSLFDLELDTEKNQFETEHTAGGANEGAQDIDSALQKLDELARRQEELAEQQSRNPKGFQSRWQQEALRREAEKLQEQMAQIARNNASQSAASSSSSSSTSPSGSGRQSGTQASAQQALDRLRQANDDMRRAASPEQSVADARRAADRLREASNLLGRMRNEDASQRVNSMVREGDRLAGEQRSQEERLRRALDLAEITRRPSQGQSEAASQEMAGLADDRQRMANDLAGLEKEMQNAIRDLASGQGAAAAKLRDGLSGMQQSELRAHAQRSADMLRRGMNPSSNTTEAAITAGLERLNEQLHQAQRTVSGQQRNPEEALDQVERLRRQVETLARNLGAGNPQPGQGRENNDQAGQQHEGNTQAGVTRGSNPQMGQGSEGGGNANGLRGGTPGDPRDAGEYVGGYDPGGFTWPQGKERQPKPTSQADIERAFQEALRDLNELRQSVKGEPGPLGDIHDLLRELNRLDPRRFPGNPAMLEELHAQVLTGVDKIELRLRRDLDEKQTGQVRSGDTLRVPAGYQDSVAEYFRRLSKRPNATNSSGK